MSATGCSRGESRLERSFQWVGTGCESGRGRAYHGRVARSRLITDATLLAHVNKLGEDHPPIRMDSVDFTVNNPDVLRTRFAGVLDYLARVELEVERNVLELLTIMPNPSEADKVFYSDVWYDQEIAHGQILDELKRRIDLPEAEPLLQVGFAVQALGALAKYKPPIIVVDFGTATTFCAITERAEYLGGTIAPGLKISSEALFEKTAKLPKVELEHTAIP